MDRKRWVRDGRRIGAPGPTDSEVGAPHDAGGDIDPDGEGVGGQSPARTLNPTDLQALHLRETAAGCYLYAASAGVFPQFETAAFTAYVEALRRDAGDPGDPIEGMLIEQLAMAHHAVGRLHWKAATAGTLEAAAVYLGAACRLTGEFRKSALALKGYRAPATPMVPLVKQEAGGLRPLAHDPGGELGNGPEEQGHDSTLRLA